MDEHNDTYHNQEIDQYNCSNCAETFKSKDDFEEHTNVCQCASNTDCCCPCQKEKSKRKKGGLFQEMYGLTHKESITAKKSPKEPMVTFKCSLCESGFRSKSDCDIHCEMHLESGMVFKCTLCEEATFANKGRLNEHYDTVHEGNILFGRNVSWNLQCLTC